jgi:hypothetical protein
MFAAMRYVELHGGDRVVAIGRIEVLQLYQRCGLRPLGRRMQCGSVTFELLTATIAELSRTLEERRRLIRRVQSQVEWPEEIPLHSPVPCFHGGAFFTAIGADFSNLARRQEIISADVLDAWFAPAPGVIAALSGSIEWISRTSPPTQCEGMISAIARARGIHATAVMAGGGSSDLIFLALRHWLTPQSRVLLLDPTYGEYAHVLHHVIRCQDVRRLAVARENGYEITEAALDEAARGRFDLIVLVNPNSPTG